MIRHDLRFCVMLFSCPVATIAETYYPLGPDNAAHQGVLYQTGSATSERFAFADAEHISCGQTSDYTFFALFRFNLEGLPPNPTRVRLWLYCLPVQPPHTNDRVRVSRVTSSWSVSPIKGLAMGEIPEPRRNDWRYFDITAAYKVWTSAPAQNPNLGLALHTYPYDGSLVAFASEQYPLAQFRPVLAIETEYSLFWHFPLPGGFLPTMITGYDYGDDWRTDVERTIDPAGYKFKHTGIDVRANPGDTVLAISDCMIMYARRDPKWGGYVVSRHKNGNMVFTCTYTHVLPIAPLADEGFVVFRGNPLATIAPGNENYNPHLHFQIQLGEYDPSTALRGRLPEVAARTAASPTVPEKAFPGDTANPHFSPWD